MPLSGFTTNTLSDVLYDSGVALVGGVPHSASRGGLRVTIEEVWHEVEYDGRAAPTAGLDYVLETICRVSGTFIEFGPTQIARLLRDITGVTAGGVTTYTPRDRRALFAEGEYIEDLSFEVTKADGDIVAVPMSHARVEFAVAGQDRNEGLVDVTFTAVLDPAVAVAA